jgi:hypothetical protein
MVGRSPIAALSQIQVDSISPRSSAEDLTNVVVAYFEFSKWGRASTPLLVVEMSTAHVGKYVDWRLIVTAPFEEDVELFVTDVDGSALRVRPSVPSHGQGLGKLRYSDAPHRYAGEVEAIQFPSITAQADAAELTHKQMGDTDVREALSILPTSMSAAACACGAHARYEPNRSRGRPWADIPAGPEI